MSQEEKAKELVDKLQKVCGSFGNGIAAAVICVDEIIKELKSVEFDYDMEDRYKDVCLSKTSIPYWERVKLEVKAL